MVKLTKLWKPLSFPVEKPLEIEYLGPLDPGISDPRYFKIHDLVDNGESVKPGIFVLRDTFACQFSVIRKTDINYRANFYNTEHWGFQMLPLTGEFLSLLSSALEEISSKEKENHFVLYTNGQLVVIVCKPILESKPDATPETRAPGPGPGDLRREVLSLLRNRRQTCPAGGLHLLDGSIIVISSGGTRPHQLQRCKKCQCYVDPREGE